MPRLRVNGELCTGQGNCYAVAPQLLDYDEGGLAVPRDEDIDVPAPDASDAQEAAQMCPEHAITYVD